MFRYLGVTVSYLEPGKHWKTMENHHSEIRHNLLGWRVHCPLGAVRSDRLYNDGRQCDCRCGMPDPDCALTSSPGLARTFSRILEPLGTQLWHSHIQQPIAARMAAGSSAGFSPPGGFHGELVEEGI